MKDSLYQLLLSVLGIVSVVFAVRFRNAKKSVIKIEDKLEQSERKLAQVEAEKDVEVFVVKAQATAQEKMDEDRKASELMLEKLKEVKDDPERKDAERISEERKDEERIKQVADEKVIRLASRINSVRISSGRSDRLHIHKD